MKNESNQMSLLVENITRRRETVLEMEGSKLNWDSDANTQHDTLPQVGRDEVKARMKELESELARAEQTSALREEVTNSFAPCYQFFLQFFKPFLLEQGEGRQHLFLGSIFCVTNSYWSTPLHSEIRLPTGLFVCSI